jgi:membrane protein YqaA with SNARE-associated domain
MAKCRLPPQGQAAIARRTDWGRFMLRGLYDWTMALAGRKSAEIWLAIIAFIESSIFLVPADVLFLPMVLSRRDRAYRYALVATVASVLGGIAGWMLGYFAFESVAKPVLEFYGKLDTFESLRSSVSFETILLLLVTSGLAHLPPIKVVTILSGVAGVNIWLFIVSAIVARGARFFFLAWLLRRYGAPIQEFIEKRLGLIAGAGAAALILLYLAYRWFAH